MADKDEGKIRAMASVQAIFDRYHLIAAKRPAHHADFDYEVMKSVKLLDAGLEGWVLFELLISEKYSNLNDVMHGGAAGVIFDMCTTMALGPLARPGYWYFLGGVTRTLNISYLKAVPIGTTARIRAWVTQVGRTMAMIRGEMTSVDGKVIYCTYKVNTSVKPQHMVVKVPWDEQMELEEEAREKVRKATRL